ncbi:flavin-containing monooxygenase [Marinicella marina]|uniref:flavin-containing monooxygenase n=1 Tax=Marinicella marina TaxID=2996016 RepID=UPI0024BC0DBC|nr:NAD(P)/FAD-dependent oxidoreductase [Marinicella marina]MDJ1140017.1 NAD(P)/FAD-dependent oxidoreductase [Marinicella marina]
MTTNSLLHHETIIIGAGFSGVGLAMRLQQQNHSDYLILERGDDIGGVWRDNTYPAAACDVPSSLYSFSFAQNTHWSRSFSGQSEIMNYLKDCVDAHIPSHKIQLNQCVEAAEFNQVTGLWHVTTANKAIYSCRFLISACGQLCQPAWPNLTGSERFKGTQFHSAQWQHEHDFQGKHVAVVGTGASAIQFIPEIAKLAATVTIFQRTAPYVLPKRDRVISQVEQKLMSRLPKLQDLIRKAIYTKNEFRSLYMGPLKAVLKLYTLRWQWFMHSQIKDQEKRHLLTPDYVIGCKRILIANNYYSTLNLPHIKLVAEPIKKVTQDGVMTESGKHHTADTLIYATGFKAADFLQGIHIKGTSDESLQQQWHQGAYAYHGITVSGFPNFMLCYDPNTNIGHNSMIHVLESQFNYICDYIDQIKNRNINYMDLKADVESKYRVQLQKRLANTVWQQGGCHSWYQNAAGTNTNNWPGMTLSYRLKTKQIDIDDYHHY